MKFKRTLCSIVLASAIGMMGCSDSTWQRPPAPKEQVIEVRPVSAQLRYSQTSTLDITAIAQGKYVLAHGESRYDQYITDGYNLAMAAKDNPKNEPLILTGHYKTDNVHFKINSMEGLGYKIDFQYDKITALDDANKEAGDKK